MGVQETVQSTYAVANGNIVSIGGKALQSWENLGPIGYPNEKKFKLKSLRRQRGPITER